MLLHITSGVLSPAVPAQRQRTLGGRLAQPIFQVPPRSPPLPPLPLSNPQSPHPLLLSHPNLPPPMSTPTPIHPQNPSTLIHPQFLLNVIVVFVFSDRGVKMLVKCLQICAHVFINRPQNCAQTSFRSCAGLRPNFGHSRSNLCSIMCCSRTKLCPHFWLFARY